MPFYTQNGMYFIPIHGQGTGAMLNLGHYITVRKGQIMGFFIPQDTDFKQHVNLSKPAWDCIQEDICNFENMPEKINWTGFINRVLRYYCDEAKASVSNYSALTGNEMPEAVIKEYIDDLTIQKGAYKRLRLNKDVEKMLLASKDSSYYNDNLGKYIKAVVEEYIRLPFVERERIYHKEILQIVEDTIETSRMISVSLGSQKFIMMPYRVMTDKSNMYHYITGYHYREDDQDSFPDNLSITSYRLSNIKEIRVLRTRKYKLNSRQKEQIESEIKNKEVRFLCETEKTFKVYLTDNGLKNYHYQIYQRPSHHSIDTDGHILEFRCTERQITNYFFKFGQDAIVLEPADLRMRILESYRKAYESYRSLEVE